MTSHLKPLSGILLVGAVAALFVWLGWIGHLASDDRAYISTAEAWFSDFPMVPESHWAVRHPLTLAISASISMFGAGEFQSILPTLLYGVSLLVLLFLGTSAVFGPVCATIVALILVATPIMAESMSVAGVDVVEAFFVFASLGAFLLAAEREGSLIWLIGSGLLAGLAFLSRETAVALIVFFGMSFLFTPLFERWRYFFIAGGFWLIFGAEMLYYWLATGDPLLRIDIALGTIDLVDPETPGTGNISHNRWLGPILALLINNEFGAIYWLAIGAGLWLWRSEPTLTTLQNRTLINVIGLGAVWFVIVGYALDLRALPRYFLVPTISAAFTVGLCGWLWVRAGWTKASGVVFAFYFGTGLLLVDLSNQQILLPERTAVLMAVRDESLRLYTDPRTAWRSEKLAKWHGVTDDRIIGAPPPSNELYIFSQHSVARGNAGPYGPFVSSEFEPSRDWQVIRTYRQPTTIGRLIIFSDLAPILEKIGLARLVWKTPAVILYRVPARQ